VGPVVQDSKVLRQASAVVVVVVVKVSLAEQDLLHKDILVAVGHLLTKLGPVEAALLPRDKTMAQQPMAVLV
jgi:hypothetical protein